ncbi:hypothetical protein F0562_032924 [Nyssa sinensis]|uniref:Uncharacterized protein n=1 Tax=Nyssa sinensis TaxID=561372 RepID=A0A5J5ARP3_9ASTE|nr:hypothetical protein F0562_032924 [Nyssa sinensis]
MGIDPVTHKPKSDALGSGQWKGTANLSHMAQWESARLEAEARLVRESKMERVEMNSVQFQDQIMAFSMDSLWTHEGSANALLPNFMEGITADILLENSSDHNSLNFSGNSNNDGGSCGGSGSGGDFEENKNYWNSILNMVNSTTTGSSPVMI